MITLQSRGAASHPVLPIKDRSTPAGYHVGFGLGAAIRSVIHERLVWRVGRFCRSELRGLDWHSVRACIFAPWRSTSVAPAQHAKMQKAPQWALDR